MKRISTEKVELPTCSICLESFGTNEPNKPYFLLCGHSYHLHCIKKISEMSKSNEIICPLCRSPTPGTASSLKLNFSLLDLLEVFQKEKQEQDEITPCDECGFVASLFCVSCEVPYCVEHDKIAHSTVKAMASHNRIPILKKNLHVVKKCKLHNERLKIFCITCQLSICILCRDYGLHKTHRTDLVPSIEQHSQSELSGTQKKPEKSSQSLDKTLQVLAQRLRQGLSQTIPQGLSQTIPQGLSQTIPQTIPRLSQTIPQGLPQSMPQGLSQTIPQGITQIIPRLSQTIPQGLPQTIPQGLSQTIPQSIPRLSQTIPQELPQTIPQGLSQSIPQGLSQGLIQAHFQAHQAVAQAQAQAQARHHLQSIPSQQGILGTDIIQKYTIIWEGIYSFKNDPQATFTDRLQVLAFKPHLTKKDFGIDEFPAILVLEMAHITERLLLEYIPMYPIMQIKSPSLKQRLHVCATVRLRTRFLVIFKHKDSVIAIILPLAFLPPLALTPVKLELTQGTLPKLTENQISPGQQGWMGPQEGGMSPQQGRLLSTRSGYTLQQGLVQSVALTDQHPGTVGISMGSELPVSMGLNMGVSLSQNQSSISSVPSFLSVSSNSIIMNNNPKS